MAGSSCLHEEPEFLGEQKAERGVNRYFRCKKCGSVIILSENNMVFEIRSKKG